MIARTLSRVVKSCARQYPVVTVTGPRQSGKTTLCRALFPGHIYASLEPLDVREYAQEDPRGFLAEHADGAIIDEVQNAPALLHYLQEEVDARPRAGRFILTGSQHFGLSHAISQSLAGRTAVLQLLPPSLDELRRFPSPPETLWQALHAGAYPRIHDQRIAPARWLADYVTTYVQRDVRQVLNVGDLSTFTTFLRLCAGRSGQELNLSTLGADAGISHNTARAWLSVLEVSMLCTRVPAWHVTVRKQAVKAPKLHFLDSGLLCYLLGIRELAELQHHPLRGAVFESWVVAEAYKARVHAGLEPSLFHYRDAKGLEVDLVVERGDGVTLAEAKSGATVVDDFFSGIRRVRAELERAPGRRDIASLVVYGGEQPQRRAEVTVAPWSQVDQQQWR